jgi:formyltetrahydrofolate synthetase
VEESLGFALGGEGTKDLAEIVLSACDQGSELKYLYDLSTSIEKKVEILAKKVYGASEIIWSNSAMVKAQRYEKMGWGELPICMAKTHSSISANPKLLGRPTGHQFPIRNIRIAAGAGFVYPLAGDIRTLPGLPKIPNAYNMDLDANGNISGMS